MSGQAEDVIQEILLRAFASRDQLRAPGKFRAWIWSIALNEIREHFRRDRDVVSIDELPHFDLTDGAGSPLSRVEAQETSQWVRHCVAKLPERERKAIRLRDLEDRTIDETAAALHSSTPGAKMIHFRARKRLARILLASGRRRGQMADGLAA